MQDFHTTISVSGYDFHVIGPDTDFDLEPFSYTIRLKSQATYDEDGNQTSPMATIGRCSNIPCQGCFFQTSCKDGMNLTETLTDYVLNELPELFI